MSTNKGSIEKIDWQKADARILGQILAAQNIDFVLPDTSRIAEFFAETLNTMPGIASCRVCLEDETVQRGEMDSEICEGCQVSRKRIEGQEKISPLLPEFDFKCGLGEQPDMYLNAVASLHHHFGFFVFRVGDLNVFDVYKPFISNLANYVALSLESRLQRDLLERARNEMELRVTERTEELKRTNENIVREIAAHKQAKDSLAASEQKLRGVFDAMEEALTLNELVYDESGEIVDYVILEANPAFERMTGFTREQAVGRKATEIYGMTTEYINFFWKEHLHDKHPIKTDMYVEQINQWKHISTSIPVQNKFVVSFFDITKLKNIENSLRESEERYRTLFEQASDGIFIADPEGNYLDVNSSGCSMLGYTRDEILNLSMQELVDAKEQAASPLRLDELRSGKTVISERMMVTQSGALLPVEISGTVLDNGNFLGLVRNITERKQVEMQLHASEQLFRALVENSPDFIARYDREFRRIYVNPAIQSLFASSTESVLGTTPTDQTPLYAPQMYIEHLRQAIETATESVLETPFRTAQGEMHWGQIRFVPELDSNGEVASVLTIGRDIHEIKENEQRFRRLAENFPDFVLRSDHDGRIAYINPALEKALGIPADVIVGKMLHELPYLADLEQNDEILALVQRTSDEDISNESELHWATEAGERIFEIRHVPEKDAAGNIVSVLSIARDVTERKQMEAALATREKQYRTLVENIPDLIVRYDTNLHRTYVNPAWEKASGLSAEEVLSVDADAIPRVPNPTNAEYLEKIRLVLETGVPQEAEFTWINAYGAQLFLEYIVVPEYNNFGNIAGVLSVGRDSTERQHYEREREAIITVSNALRKATTRSEILTVILDQMLGLFDADGSMVATPSQNSRDIIIEIGRGEVGKRFTGLTLPQGQGVSRWVIANKKPYLNNEATEDFRFYRPDLLGDSHCVISVPLIAHAQAIGALWLARRENFSDQDLRLLNAIADIAANAIHRVTLHEKTEQQLQRLTTLHQIDLAISANLDLNVTLNVILGYVKDELEVDAASILLLNPITHTLDYAAGIGFRTHNIERSHVKLGIGCAGQAAQEQRTISSLDLGQAYETFNRFSFLSGENFTSHYATPLVVKGQVKGVLEIFYRAAIEPEYTWLGYFETLATQAAIAIENTSLFENLQRSNMELTLAYDATIEGWSRALDLRDRETEGHTQRVAEMALELAGKMGMSDVEKLDLRRGALLHDIGKMGIPDAILLKPGPLSEDEWKIMRQHPLYAYQMLFPIKYLKRALEIPYCHHEKWDGSGYSRGLKGEEIPLAARVFAVVDVFDALISDRPYSKPWSREQAYRYIQEQAGKHFDPQIVKVFLEIR